jgi:hypothetical protein
MALLLRDEKDRHDAGMEGRGFNPAAELGWNAGALQAAEKRSNAVILSAAKDPGSSREGRELSKLRGFFAQNAGSE